MSPRLWWNRAPASTAHLVAAVRDEIPGSVSMASHSDADCPVLDVADEIVDEPTADRYVEESIELCRTHRVDLILPRVRGADLADAGDALAAVGTRVLSSPAASIRLADDKVAAYEAAARIGLRTPPVAVATDDIDLAHAAEQLVGAGHRICVRPRVGEGSDGFRVVVEAGADGRAPGRFRGNRVLTVTLDEVARALSSGEVGEVLVAGLLGGTEWSVDVWAHHGETVLALPRRRDRFGTYVVERCPPAEEMAGALVDAWALHGVVNVQCFVTEGRASLVEVNPRPAGGLHHTHHTGVVLIAEAIRAELDGGPQRDRRPDLPQRVLLAGRALPRR